MIPGRAATLEVSGSKTALLYASGKTFKRNETKKITATLTTSDGKPLKIKTVKLKLNGNIYQRKTDKNGKVTFNATKLKKRGTYKAKFWFVGYYGYLKSARTIKIKVK